MATNQSNELALNNENIPTISNPVKNWVKDYCLGIVNTESGKELEENPGLALLLNSMSFEESGDYSRQIEQLQQRPVGITLPELVQNYRRLIILGRAGSGKTIILRNLLKEQAHRVLGDSSANRPMLPVYLRPADLSTQPGEDNQFQTILKKALSHYNAQPLPNNLFSETIPLVLLDGLETLEPAAAPGFLHSLGNWFKQAGQEASLIVACRHLDFVLYHPWFKPEQNWQFFGLRGLDWKQVRTTLATRMSETELQKLEPTGIPGLVTNTSLFFALQPRLGEVKDAQTFLQVLLKIIGQDKAVNVAELAQHSPLLSKLLGNLPKTESTFFKTALDLGLLEKHPLEGWIRLTNASLNDLLAAWYCRSQKPQELPATFTRIFSMESVDKVMQVVRATYLLSPADQRENLFSAVLKEVPDETRLDLLIEAARIDPAFIETWKNYLSRNADNSSLLILCSATGNPPYRRERLLISEMALNMRLEKSGQSDDSLYLELARTQELLGKEADALISYNRLPSNFNLPTLEGRLSAVRLLNHSEKFEQAFGQLESLNQRLQQYQAEVSHQIAVAKRNMKDYPAALEHAEKALQLGANSERSHEFRHNMALIQFESGQKEKAEKELATLTVSHPNFTEAFYDLGRVQMERGMTELALVNFRRAVELDPATSRYLADLGRALLSQNRYDEAYTYLKGAITQENGQADLYTALGMAALRLKKQDEALEYTGKAAELAGANITPETLILKGAAEYGLGKYNEAAATVAAALKQEAANPELQIIAGLTLEAADKADTALRHYWQALTLLGNRKDDRLTVLVNLRLARTLRETNLLDKANQHLQEILKQEPNLPEALYEAGMIALTKKLYQEAVTHLGKGAALIEKALPTLTSIGKWVNLFEEKTELAFELPYRYAIALNRTGQQEQGQKILRGLLARSDRANEARLRGKIQYRLGQSLVAQQNFGEALMFLRGAVADEPKDARYRFVLATALKQTGETERALSELDAARELAPEMHQLYPEIAELQLATRKHDTNLLMGSLNLYLKALAGDPTNRKYLQRGAVLAAHLGHYNHASEFVTRLLKQDPDLLDAHLLAACVYERKGELEKALEEIRLALAGSEAKNSEYFLVAARLARKTGAMDELEHFLGLLKARESLPLTTQAAICYEEGFLAQWKGKSAEAAEWYRQAVELRAKFAESKTHPALEEIYNHDHSATLKNPAEAADSQALLAGYRIAYAGALREAGNIEQAINELDQAVQLNPNLASSHGAKGELLRQQERHQEALDSFKAAAELEPTPTRFYELGKAHLKVQTAGQEALAAFERAGLEGAPGKSDYYVNLGGAYLQLGRHNEAKTSFSRALQFDPKNPDLHVALAQVYTSTGDHMGAVQPLQEAVLNAPDNPLYRLELARVYEELGWMQEASGEYKNATDLNPTEAKTWLKSGQALIRTGRLDQGRNALVRALELDEKLAEAHFELGNLYLKAHLSRTSQHDNLPEDLLGWFGPSPAAGAQAQNPESAVLNSTSNVLELARKHLEQAANLHSTSGEYLAALAQAEFAAGEYNTARIICEKCLLANPSDYEICLLLAETNLRLDRPNTAWKVAEQAIKLYKHREDAWLLAARSAHQAGEPKKAIECLELYLKLNSRQIIGPMAYILMAQAYLALNQNEQALEQLEVAQARLKAQFATPGPTFVALRARILRSLGKDDEAHNYYQQALQLDPQNPAMHNELGDALMARGKTEEALKVYQKALQLNPDSPEYYYNAGVAALRSMSLPGQFSRRAEAMQQQAIDYLSRASQLNPVVAQYWYDLARAYGTVPNYRLMQQALQKAMTQSVAFAENEAPQIEYMRLYAATCLKLGDYEGAQETLNQILAMLPEDHETLNELGDVAYRKGNYGVAFNYFRKAEHHSNDHPRYLANMSRALLKLERLEEAQELVALVGESDDHYVQHQLGAVLLERGNPADALEKLRIAAEHDPGNAEFRYYLGRAHLQMGELGAATQEYHEAVAQAPLQHRWHAELGEIHLKERAYLPALESLRMAVQLDPANLDYRYNLSIALAANGELQQAIQVVREVIIATHGEVGAEWHYLLGRLVAELGHFEEALKCFERAHGLEPDKPHYKVDLAKTRRLRGEPIEEVKNLLMEAIKDNPDNLRSFEELAYVYEASDDPEAAIRTLEARLSEVLQTVSTY